MSNESHPSESLSRSQLIAAMVKLGKAIHPNQLPEAVLQASLTQNPWFTEFYVRQSLMAIQPWFVEEMLTKFLDRYPRPRHGGQRVGIIAAGNLPLVGLHDVLITVLAGHHAYVKASHQDRVLMDWVLGTWSKVAPEIKKFLHPVDSLKRIDFLLATGSNNTARYLEHAFHSVQRIVRGNRFSVAILDKYTSESELEALCMDIYLYNGLGCRNVSNLLVVGDFEPKDCLSYLNEYPLEQLNYLYLERVLYETARMKTLGTTFWGTSRCVLIPNETLTYSSMGYLNMVTVPSREQALHHVQANRDRIQCVVGLDTDFGTTQYPNFDVFADQLDTMDRLTSL
ncbi:acyl-CoA reductase [Pontibacter sp. G13]|uniref:acyl-CoA reductase n=1 Tax=Pontibacter sp. G13 TaxID=3074898 RepID=UPI00288C0518|nr:acyl-CoA reductase [Pontibacter sp. G13]WNJ16012.1 acyl-CoA reductase [Pontibacter sp. G13]